MWRRKPHSFQGYTILNKISHAVCHKLYVSYLIIYEDSQQEWKYNWVNEYKKDSFFSKILFDWNKASWNSMQHAMNIFINSSLRFLTFLYHFCFQRLALDVSLNVIKVDFFSFFGRCDFHCNIFAFICKKIPLKAKRLQSVVVSRIIVFDTVDFGWGLELRAGWLVLDGRYSEVSATPSWF